jgi:hypothetical protein
LRALATFRGAAPACVGADEPQDVDEETTHLDALEAIRLASARTTSSAAPDSDREIEVRGRRRGERG